MYKEQGGEMTGVWYDYTLYQINFHKEFLYPPPQVHTQTFMGPSARDPNVNSTAIYERFTYGFNFWKIQGGNPAPNGHMYIYWLAQSY